MDGNTLREQIKLIVHLMDGNNLREQIKLIEQIHLIHT